MATAVTSFESSRAAIRRKKRRRRDDEPSVATPGPPTGKKLDAVDVIALQKLLGNKATEQVLHQQRISAPEPDEDVNQEHFLSEHVREALRQQTKEQLTEAAETYHEAFELVRQELEVEARGNAAFATLMVQTFFADRAETSRELFRKILEQFPIAHGPTVNRASLQGHDHQKVMKDFYDDRVEDPADAAAERIAKAAARSGKGVGNAILEALEVGLEKSVEELANDFDDINDIELLALWANYQEKLAKLELYKILVRMLIEQARRERLAKTGIGGARGQGAPAAAGDGGDSGNGGRGSKK